MLLDEDLVPGLQLLLLRLLLAVVGLLLLLLLQVVPDPGLLLPVGAPLLLEVLRQLGPHLPAKHHLVGAEACGLVRRGAVGHEVAVDDPPGVLLLGDGCVHHLGQHLLEHLHEPVGLGVLRRAEVVLDPLLLQVLLEVVGGVRRPAVRDQHLHVA